MPPYLRFTPFTSGCRRETTTHRAVRARRPRLWWRPGSPDGLAAVDEPDARPVLRRREGGRPAAHGRRSEEHTSELQSRLHLVCRLLLEKKKKKTKTHVQSTRAS